MNCTTPKEFLQHHKLNIVDQIEPITEEIECGLEKPFKIVENKVIIPLPKHPEILPHIQDEIIKRYQAAGWKYVHFNTNASYSGYREIYLFLPKP